uniref:Uncharacterized protein n=1 Tax=Oscillatoriales cyanobacterium SpSt-418 TaxID=2282169 RepID=A0A7C3PGF3_9CYAN
MQVAGVERPPSQKTQRLPFQKKHLIFESPKSYEKRILRYDPKTGKPIYYDPKPRVILLDAKSGKYAFKWIGYDGKEKTIIFQRADAIDAIISASTSKIASGRYLYIYNIENLPSSGQYLSGFAVQTHTSDVSPIRMSSGYIGKMSKNKEMKDGNWIYFGSSYIKLVAVPGRNIEFRLESSAPPGLVECRIHAGDLGLKGVGEEMPQELENILPYYQDWPSGYTIGPIDNLKTLSPSERAKYILGLLPQFQRLGWITGDARRWYEQNLMADNLENIYKRADQDLKTGDITTEVFAIIQGMRH